MRIYEAGFVFFFIKTVAAKMKNARLNVKST